MKITMLATISGLRDGVAWPPARAAMTVPDDEAAHLIAGGLAKKYEKADEVEAPEAEVKGPEIPEPQPVEPVTPDTAEIGHEKAPAKAPRSRPARKTAAKKTAAATAKKAGS